MSYGELHYPTRPESNGPIADLESAVELAGRVLCENGMTDFSVTDNGVSDWNGFYLFRYHNTANPDEVYGGGASLVVRRKDGLGGMVHVPPDWMEEDLDKFYLPIATAFAKFDEEQASMGCYIDASSS